MLPPCGCHLTCESHRPVGVKDGEFEYKVCITNRCMFSTDRLEAALDRAFMEEDANG